MKWSFDTNAGEYEKIRPYYPAEVFDAIFKYSGIGDNSDVLEIGPGAGNATLPFLIAGCKLTAVECGSNFLALCKEKFREYRKFSIVGGKFEEVRLQPESFDLVFSATAFHWIEQIKGYAKVHSLLKYGGSFARFANHPFPAKDNPELRYRLDRIYAEYCYGFHSDKPRFKGLEIGRSIRNSASAAEKVGFVTIQNSCFRRKRILSASNYITLLGTYSDHMAIPETMRKAFFLEIKLAIDEYGGTITISDTIELEMARKA